MSGRTRTELAREVPLTQTELYYLARILDRDIRAMRGDKQQWDAPAATVFVERLQSKMQRALQRRQP